MKKNILDSPQHFKKGVGLAKNIKIQSHFDEFNNVVFSGMGGSALPGEVLNSWLDLLIPLHLNRGYRLPSHVTAKTLAIFCSYSGNTEECLAAYQEALDRKLVMAAITSNGKLKELCKQDNVPYVEIPTGLVPRMALCYQFVALCSILTSAGVIEDKSDEIEKMADNLKPAKQEKQGREIAEKIKGKIPIIYSSYKLKSLSYIWKIKFNENAKIPSFAHCFSELNHNELESFGSETPESMIALLHVIILQDASSHPRVKKRMELTAKILEKNGLAVEMINSTGKTLLERIFSLILLADWVSYYLSIEYGVDPLPTKTIDDFKEELGK